MEQKKIATANVNRAIKSIGSEKKMKKQIPVAFWAFLILHKIWLWRWMRARTYAMGIGHETQHRQQYKLLLLWMRVRMHLNMSTNSDTEHHNSLQNVCEDDRKAKRKEKITRTDRKKKKTERNTIASHTLLVVTVCYCPSSRIMILISVIVRCSTLPAKQNKICRTLFRPAGQIGLHWFFLLFFYFFFSFDSEFYWFRVWFWVKQFIHSSYLPFLAIDSLPCCRIFWIFGKKTLTFTIFQYHFSGIRLFFFFFFGYDKGIIGTALYELWRSSWLRRHSICL